MPWIRNWLCTGCKRPWIFVIKKNKKTAYLLYFWNLASKRRALWLNPFNVSACLLFTLTIHCWLGITKSFNCIKIFLHLTLYDWYERFNNLKLMVQQTHKVRENLPVFLLRCLMNVIWPDKLSHNTSNKTLIIICCFVF